MATPTALASASSSPVTAGAFQDPLGNVLANGSLVFDLSQTAAVTGGGELVPLRVKITLDANGKVSPSQSIFRNTDLTPSGTTYRMQAFDSNGNFAGDFGAQSIAGTAPIDLAVLTPTSISGSTLSFIAPPSIIASGTATLGTTAIGAGAAATVVSATATSALSTDKIAWNFNSSPGSGYTSGLYVLAYITAGNVNFLVINPTAGSLTPAAATLNWMVLR